jgi:ParB family transcriptional regulator, chromosome partitioning protein
MASETHIHDIGDLLGEATNALFGERKGIADIELFRLRPNPYQPRKVFNQEDIQELASSIQERGLLQPIRVAEIPDEPGFYYIILGERRFRAHEHLKVPTIKALITTWEAEHAALDALVENIQRQDLDPFEIARGVTLLMERHNLNQEEVGRRLGKSRVAINRILQIGSLPEVIRQEYTTHPASMTMLLEIAKHDQLDDQLAAWQNVKDGNITSRETVQQERLAKQTKISPAQKPSKNEKTLDRLAQAIQQFEHLTDDEGRIDSRRLGQYEDLYRRFTAALEKAQTKAKRGRSS